MDFVTSALLLSWVAIALLALVVSGLVRQVHQLSRGGVARAPRHPGVTPGSPAPHAGELLDEGQETLLLFLSAECRTCAEVLDEADRLLADDATPAPRAVYAGAAPATSTAVPVVDHRPDLFTAYDAIATPFAVLVGASGHVRRSEPLGSPAALRELLADSRPSQPRSV
ncbi:hypothetical protein C0Q64_20780 [Streptomyces albidoflavus]|nr:hypothetical protein [Streptomyces albidoflavus]MBV7710016.1 hypothetical protein [Streptomyces albidoflavus]RZD82067.1 hypothetical protein C0Q63_21660 [Streptomyces albidoflavus]RZD96014.1 hypothetical protein C0Q64_20780 [Streptomyces albidoflavus]RZD99974.1 hypothetical protein C0Q65_21015 [Streptomyces albidoflavus]